MIQIGGMEVAWLHARGAECVCWEYGGGRREGQWCVEEVEGRDSVSAYIHIIPNGLNWFLLQQMYVLY